jgi:copper(I)-binding protein
MRLPIAAAASVLLAAAGAAPPKVTDAWSRPAAQGSTGAGFMTMTGGGAADALVGAASPWARSVSIHQSRVAGGVASMAEVARVPAPAGARVVFAPGGYHLMFMGLTRPLKAGDRLPATLVFASGAKVEAAFVVRVGPPAAGHAHH